MARRKQDAEPSYVRLAIAFGVITLSLVLFKAGVFTSIANLWVDRVHDDMQKVTDRQTEKIKTRQEEQTGERAARDAAPAEK